jgi:hypothetical protein
MDLDALQREIGSAEAGNGEAEDDYADPYAPDTGDEDEVAQRRHR